VQLTVLKFLEDIKRPIVKQAVSPYPRNYNNNELWDFADNNNELSLATLKT